MSNDINNIESIIDSESSNKSQFSNIYITINKIMLMSNIICKYKVYSIQNV